MKVFRGDIVKRSNGEVYLIAQTTYAKGFQLISLCGNRWSDDIVEVQEREIFNFDEPKYHTTLDDINRKYPGLSAVEVIKNEDFFKKNEVEPVLDTPKETINEISNVELERVIAYTLIKTEGNVFNNRKMVENIADDIFEFLKEKGVLIENE